MTEDNPAYAPMPRNDETIDSSLNGVSIFACVRYTSPANDSLKVFDRKPYFAVDLEEK